MEAVVIMNDQSKKMVVNALIKVINAAPGLYSQKNYLHSQIYRNSDVPMQELNTWMNYANQILDISYNHIGINAILSTKIVISELYSQYGVSNIQRIEQIKQELLKLTQVILQY